MKLNLDLKDAHQGPYLAQDLVRASFEIRGPTFHKSPRISVKFIGTMVVSYPTQVNAASPGQVTTVLFEQSKKIENRNFKWDEDPSSGESIYTTPIEFQFPAEANCYCNRPKRCPLPPSMDINEHDMRTEHDDGSCPSYSPKFSPLIKVEVLLPQPAILIRGQPTPVQIIVHTPTDMIESGEVYLRSVSMDLKSSVTTSIGMIPRTVTQTKHGCTMAGAVKIDSELFEVDSGAWGNFFVLNTKPTTESCFLRMDHAMEIVTGISVGLGNDIKYAVATFNVIVMDPPPAYEVGHAIHA
ncbi:hypothetical protein TARUN_2671 [Trichoderma arundinaceum]|uniref:Arrestin-like N-terminal domain-containing protein n=1 Tax=Trichoderma arundinaceum TaxID=490622 RepID=A0A395NTZ6_TRIAR|nr:hypothetical protein TARUN_2671 [Trichoderma arundinaceum]